MKMNYGIILAWIHLVIVSLCVGLKVDNSITIEIKQRTSTIHENNHAELRCIARYKDPTNLQFKWYNGTMLMNLEPDNLSFRDRMESKITIKANKWDNGVTLRCYAWSGAVHNSTQVTLNVIYEPQVTFITNPKMVEEGNGVDVACLIDSNPPATSIEWKINQGHVINSTTFRLPYVDRNSLLDKYVCQADYQGKKYNFTFRFYVPRKPELKPIEDQQAKVGDDLTVPCEIEVASPPVHTVYWTKDGDLNFFTDNPHLLLANIRPSSAGRYTCHATNTIDTSTTSFELRVRYHPGKSYIDQSMLVIWPGQNATLNCWADPPGWPQASFRWTKQSSFDDVLANKSQLVISGTQPGDTVYVCEAFNSEGYALAAKVTVTALPELPKLSMLRPQLKVQLGMVNFEIFCSVQGQIVEPIIWFKNGNVIEDDDFAFNIINDQTSEGRLITLRSTLVFRGPVRPGGTQIMLQDNGNYTCILKNDYNRTVSTMQLFVESDNVSSIVIGTVTKPSPGTTYQTNSVLVVETTVTKPPTVTEPRPETTYQTNSVPVVVTTASKPPIFTGPRPGTTYHTTLVPVVETTASKPPIFTGPRPGTTYHTALAPVLETTATKPPTITGPPPGTSYQTYSLPVLETTATKPPATSSELPLYSNKVEADSTPSSTIKPFMGSALQNSNVALDLWADSHVIMYVIVGVAGFVCVVIIVGTAIFISRSTSSTSSKSDYETKIQIHGTSRPSCLRHKKDRSESYRVSFAPSPPAGGQRAEWMFQ